MVFGRLDRWTILVPIARSFVRRQAVDPLSMIVGALVAGAVAKATDVGGQAVQDTYEALKNLIATRFKRAGALAALEEDPSSETQKEALQAALAKVDVVKDVDVVQKAAALVEALNKAPRAELAAVGVRVDQLEAISARFGEVNTPATGTGVHIGTAKLQQDFIVDKIGNRDPN
jgi:ubiquinone biosynthesis protein UbiJ